MTTPLIMLCLLVAPVLIGVAANRLLSRKVASFGVLGVLGVTFVFCFTGVGHFVATEPMAEMLPDWIPGRIPLVYVTGVVEIIAAVSILFPSLRMLVGWALIVMLLSFLPVNVYAALNRIGMGGHQWGPIYLLIRVPLQVVLICWIWWFAVRTRGRSQLGGSAE